MGSRRYPEDIPFVGELAFVVDRITLPGLGLILGIFFFTDISSWAFRLTSLNRILLHMPPVAVFTLALAFHALNRPPPVPAAPPNRQA